MMIQEFESYGLFTRVFKWRFNQTKGLSSMKFLECLLNNNSYVTKSN